MESKNTFSRETAKICSIKDLLKGDYVVKEGWEPNYVLVGDVHISRINIMGVVVEKINSFKFLVDDGTATIEVIDFNQNKNVASLSISDPVLIIGRPRLAENKLFIASEIITSKQLKKNSQWLSIRKKELANLVFFNSNLSKTSVEESEVSSLINVEDSSKSFSSQLTGDDVVDFLKKKDVGDGVLIEDIISYFGDDVNNIITTLLSMGEIFEIRPGRIKFLE